MTRQKKRITAALCLLLAVPVALFAQIDFQHPVLLVKNGLGSKITEVFLSDADMSDWGNNVLPRPIIPGLAHQFTLQKSLKTARVYDISVKDEKGGTYSKYGVDLLALTLVEMVPADKEAATPVAPPSAGSPSPLPAASVGNANKLIPDEDAVRARIVAAARKYMGLPYRWGSPARPTVPPASPPRQFDCSGFISQAYKDVTGVTIPRTSRVMFDQGRKITESELKPGDIIVMDSNSADRDNGANHVALYIGPGRVLQALSAGPRTGVVQTDIPGIRAAKILGYRTFVGTTSGNKQNYSPTSVTDYSFDISAPTPAAPVSQTISLELQASTMLQFAFSNQLGRATTLMYRFYREGADPGTGEFENFTVKANESFLSNLCLPKIAGKYRLQVYMGSVLLLERAWTVAN
jgi:cell wall-associated NlpC family hydrolase